MNWYKKAKKFMKAQEGPQTDTIRLYRGISQKFDEGFDLAITDAPMGYSTWTNNPKLAREYAGENGFVYEIELPKNKLGESYIDDNGERPLFYNNDKAAGLNNIRGDEYLVYHHHDDYNPRLVREFKAKY